MEPRSHGLRPVRGTGLSLGCQAPLLGFSVVTIRQPQTAPNEATTVMAAAMAVHIGGQTAGPVASVMSIPPCL